MCAWGASGVCLACLFRHRLGSCDSPCQIAKGGDREEEKRGHQGVWAGVGARTPCRCTCIQRSSGERVEHGDVDCPHGWISYARIRSPVRRSGIGVSSAAFGTFQPPAEPPRTPSRPIMNTHPLLWFPPLSHLSTSSRTASTAAGLHRPNCFQWRAEARTRGRGWVFVKGNRNPCCGRRETKTGIS